MRQKLTIALILIIGLIVIITSLMRVRFNEISVKYFDLKMNQYSFSFYKASSSEELFRISPFDDYSYQPNQNHIVYKDTYLTGSNITNQIRTLMNTFLLNKKEMRWDVKRKDGLTVTYIISSDKNIVTVTRKFNMIPTELNAIGQSVVICDKCYVTDQTKRIFFNGSTLKQDDLNLAQSLGLTPVVLSTDLLPKNITKITIVDRNFNQLYSLDNFNPTDEIYFDKEWKLLQIKTFIPRKDIKQFSQKITFS